MTHKEIYKEVSKLHTLYNERDRIAACEGAMMIMRNHRYLKEFALEIINAQRQKDIEKALAYWHKLLDSQGINEVVFTNFVKAMEEQQ